LVAAAGPFQVPPKITRIARAVTRELVRDGASAVVLTGSYVRGGAHAHSDVDLVAVFAKRPGSEPAPSRVRGGMLVTVASTTPRRVRAAFREPRHVTTFVPGWRDGVILHDPDGVAAKIKRAAERWTWESISDECDRYVAESITGLAEEAHKLAGMWAQGNIHAAAAQRSILAVWLAGVMAVHRRILFGTDNALWDAVAAAMGERWASAQRRALSEDGESLVASCRAALELYRLAAATARPTLDREQRAVTDAACNVTIRVKSE
jgi:nucleotidyltransferase-like protein